MEDGSHCRVTALFSQTQPRASPHKPADSPELDTLPQAMKELLGRWKGRRLQGGARRGGTQWGVKGWPTPSSSWSRGCGGAGGQSAPSPCPW